MSGPKGSPTTGVEIVSSPAFVSLKPVSPLLGLYDASPFVLDETNPFVQQAIAFRLLVVHVFEKRDATLFPIHPLPLCTWGQRRGWRRKIIRISNSDRAGTEDWCRVGVRYLRGPLIIGSLGLRLRQTIVGLGWLRSPSLLCNLGETLMCNARFHLNAVLRVVVIVTIAQLNVSRSSTWSIPVFCAVGPYR